MLRQAPWITEQLRGERGPLLVERRFGIEAGLCEALQQICARIEPMVLLSDAIDDRRINSERLARLPQRAAWPVCGADST
ncbi:hypothetical protein J2785_005421 [Burkholderia ambifaria]|nr:hypothetical protein [Burkholderia ambifaria]